MMEAVLSVQGLYKRYPGFALEDVSFSLAPKRIMGLIGKNGAGKSTTLKSILNMVSNFVLEYLFDRLVVFRKSIDTNDRAGKQM